MLILSIWFGRRVPFSRFSTSSSPAVHALLGLGLPGELTAWAKPNRLGRNCNVDKTMVNFDLVETR